MEYRIMHEENHRDVVVCSKCEANTQFMKLIGTMMIQHRAWFLIQFHCAECNNKWICWDREYPIGGDDLYKIPHTWTVDWDAE